MNFCVVGHLDSQILYRNSYKNVIKFGFFNEKISWASNLKLSKCSTAHSGRIFKDFEERTSPNEVSKEIKRCYELIHKLGRGVVYLGSSRVEIDHPHYLQALELRREIANLLDCTTWSGVGPGLMDAVTKGALGAQKPVGGFKIAKEAGEWTSSNFHPYSLLKLISLAGTFRSTIRFPFRSGLLFQTCQIELGSNKKPSLRSFQLVWKFVQVTHIGMPKSYSHGSRAKQIHSPE